MTKQRDKLEAKIASHFMSRPQHDWSVLHRKLLEQQRNAH